MTSTCPYEATKPNQLQIPGGFWFEDESNTNYLKAAEKYGCMTVQGLNMYVVITKFYVKPKF